MAAPSITAAIANTKTYTISSRASSGFAVIGSSLMRRDVDWDLRPVALTRFPPTLTPWMQQMTRPSPGVAETGRDATGTLQCRSARVLPRQFLGSQAGATRAVRLYRAAAPAGSRQSSRAALSLIDSPTAHLD